MGKIIFGMALIVLTLAGVIYFSLQDTSPSEVQDRYVGHFRDELVRHGVEDIGQPIEGFDASLLMLAYPGLVEQDFDGVETLEGYYEFASDKLAFVRTEEDMQSSAEQTLAREGYQTLFENVIARLNAEIDSEDDVDELIYTLDEGIETGDVSSKSCYVGGCSSHICSDSPDAVSTCEYRAEYACYREGICERQSTGACGWTETLEMQECLANLPPIE